MFTEHLVLFKKKKKKEKKKHPSLNQVGVLHAANGEKTDNLEHFPVLTWH